jgi:hypothetical protein
MADSIALRRHGKRLSAFTHEEKQAVLFDAARLTNYRGAER